MNNRVPTPDLEQFQKYLCLENLEFDSSVKLSGLEDVDGMNDQRADWASRALLKFMERTGTDASTAVSDLITNLMHLADRTGGDFDRQISVAREAYASEAIEIQNEKDHPSEKS